MNQLERVIETYKKASDIKIKLPQEQPIYYLCNNCGERYGEQGMNKELTMCKKCYEKIQIDKLHQEALNENKKSVINYIIPERYKTATFENYVIKTDAQKKVLDGVKNYTGHSGSNLILSGSIGTGKTHLAMAVINNNIQTALDFIAIDLYAKYTTISEIIMIVRQAMSYGGKMDMLEKLYSVKWLIIDEIGRQSGSDNEKNILFEILNKRYNNVLPTILISNKSGEEIENYLGSAIVDRMIETGSIFVNMTWESYRGNK